MTQAVSATNRVSGSASDSADAANAAERAEFTILIDGECPLCRHEARLLEKLDKGRGRLRLVDITDPAFDAGDYGKTFEEVMGSIHGVTRDGEVVSGMAVFRHAWAAVGWGWLWAPTGWPVLKPVFDFAYRVFAKYRLRLTGRGDVCEGGRCKV
jgi:predicted DCC family thiol-disulfide oxidoreductase YuxK